MLHSVNGRAAKAEQFSRDYPSCEFALVAGKVYNGTIAGRHSPAGQDLSQEE
jgi:hypothetical protein